MDVKVSVVVVPLDRMYIISTPSNKEPSSMTCTLKASFVSLGSCIEQVSIP